MRRMLSPLTTAVSLTAVVAVVGPANAGVLFEEDFSNYNQFAPGVTTNGESAATSRQSSASSRRRTRPSA